MVLTGNGKGKTTAAFGQALRALGQGFKVCMIQFMKGRKDGEIIAAEQYLPNSFVFYQYGMDSFLIKGNPSQQDAKQAQKGFAAAQKAVASGEFNMVILDEINVAVDFGLVPEQDLLDLIRNKPPAVHLVLTGRYATDSVREAADMVSEVTEVKHPYHVGVKGQAGIDY